MQQPRKDVFDVWKRSGRKHDFVKTKPGVLRSPSFFEHQHLSRKAKRNAHNTKENGAKKIPRYTTTVVRKDHEKKIHAYTAI